MHGEAAAEAEEERSRKMQSSFLALGLVDAEHGWCVESRIAE